MHKQLRHALPNMIIILNALHILCGITNTIEAIKFSVSYSSKESINFRLVIVIVTFEKKY